MHRGVTAPSCCIFIHRVDFEQVSRHRVLIKSRPGIGVLRHVAPPTRLRLEFPPQAGLILRCAGKVGNPFQTKQGNRPSCRDQEGRRDSDEVVLGTSMFPLIETGVSGNFCGRIKGATYRFALQGRMGLLLRCCSSQGPHLAMMGEPRGFSLVAAGFKLQSRAGDALEHLTAGPDRVIS